MRARLIACVDKPKIPISADIIQYSMWFANLKIFPKYDQFSTWEKGGAHGYFGDLGENTM